MARIPSALPARSRLAVADPLHTSRRLLRRLLDENAALRGELDDLRLLRRLAHEDTLTGLPNRLLGEERLAEELSHAERDATSRGSLLVIDVNDLRLVNDLHGHHAGDHLLREIASVLRGTLRTADVCCRTGGDEFMVLLPDIEAGGARLVMARLRGAVIRTGSRLNLPVSISIGIASWPSDGRQGAVLVRKADRAMYVEKRRLRASSRRRPPKVGFGGALVLVK